MIWKYEVQIYQIMAMMMVTVMTMTTIDYDDDDDTYTYLFVADLDPTPDTIKRDHEQNQALQVLHRHAEEVPHEQSKGGQTQ